MSEEHPAIGGSGPDPLIGTTLVDRYRIERKLGEGGMGAVYLARHVILEKVVALKVLHDEYSRRRELVERFLHEAKAASRIRHEHVIDITDFGETHTKNVFFAMEYLEGTDLAQELDKNGPPAWPRIKHIALQLCSALQAAHEAGVIHRDLKPENIYLIERQGSRDFVKVLDFGVAKLTELEEGARRLTRTGMVFGTPEYMSPEQARGDKPDTRVDVYALGCIVHEMIAGDVPFRADNFMGVLTKHLFEQCPRLVDKSHRTDYPPGLQAVIDQAMEKDRNNRFSTMNELAVALDTLTVEPPRPSPSRPPTNRTVLPPPAAPSPTPTPSAMELAPTRAVQTYPPDPLPSRRFPWLAAALGLAVAGGGGAAAYLAFVQPKDSTPAPVSSPSPSPSPDPKPAAVAPPAPEPVAVPKPDPVPEPTPDPVPPEPTVVEVVPDPPPVADKPRSHRRKPRTPQIGTSPPILAKPPDKPAVVTPPPVQPDPGTAIRPKSGLKDPFKKK